MSDKKDSASTPLSSLVDPISTIDEYLRQDDWRVNENANMSYNLSNLLLNSAGKLIAKYCLDKMYKDISAAKLHELGFIHIHDLSGGIAPYCAGWSLKALLDRGIDVGTGFVTSSPAKHLRSVINHMVNFLGIMSNEFMGACAFSDVDVLLAPYIYKEYVSTRNKLIESALSILPDDQKELNQEQIEKINNTAYDITYKEVKQSVQEFIYHLNMPNRWGGQSPFTNIVLDLHVPNDMIDQIVMIADDPLYKYDLSSSDTAPTSKYLKYGDLQKFIDLFNLAFFDVYMKGDAAGKPFTFPVITITLTDYFFNDLDTDVRNIILKANAKTGATYFQNCINGYMNGRKLDEGDSRSMCCLLPDTEIAIHNGSEIQLCNISWLLPDNANIVILPPSIKVLQPNGEYKQPLMIFKKQYQGTVYTITIDPNPTTPSYTTSLLSYDINKQATIKNKQQQKSQLIKNELTITNDHPQSCYIFDVSSQVIKNILLTPHEIEQYMTHTKVYIKDVLGRYHEIISIAAKPYKGLVYDICFTAENAKQIEDLNKKYNLNLDPAEILKNNIPYFIANGLETHNCRLQIDVKEMLAYSKGLFSAGDYVGSVGVVTLNMAVIGYLSRCYGKQILFDHIEAFMDAAKESLLIKKKVVVENLKRGLFPFTKEYLPYKEFESHFLTIGYCGLHECLLNYGIKGGLASKEGLELAKEILQFMNKKINEYKDETELLFNLEATPAEGASYRLAKTAKKYLPDLILSGEGDECYLTNSCHLPVEEQGDFLQVLIHQNELQPLHSGGTVVHFYLGHELDTLTIYNTLKILAKSNLPYFTLTPIVSYCPIHGPIIGNYEYCPYDHTEEELRKIRGHND